MFNQQYSLDQSGSQSSQQSQTFLTVPRLIQTTVLPDLHSCSAHQQVVQKNVNFENPQTLHKSEHKESLEEGELIASRQSFDRRDFNSKQIDEVEENYKSLRQFQIEVLNVQQRKLITNTRKYSDTSDFSQRANQFRKFSENVDNYAHKQSLSCLESANNSPQFKGIQTNPLLEQEFPQKDSFVEYSAWNKKTILIIRFLGKIMRTSPSIIKKSHIKWINDLGSNLEMSNHNMLSPYNKYVSLTLSALLFLQKIFIVTIYLHLAYDLYILLIIYFGFTLLNCVCYYNMGRYKNGKYITSRKALLYQHILIDLINILGIVIAMFINKWGVFLCLSTLLDVWNKNRMSTFMIFILVLAIQISICIVADQLSDLIFESGFSLYFISAEWTIYQLTNSGNSNIAFEQNQVMRLMSILLALAGYFIQIWLLKLIIQFQPQQVYPISQQLNDRINRFRNRPKLQNYKFDDLRADIACQLKQELYLPFLQKAMPFSDKLKVQLCQFVESQIYHDGDQLLQENEVMDKFFFLIKGEIGEFKYKKQITQNRIPLESFYSQKPHSFSIQCLSECHIGSIKLDHFIQQIKQYEQDFEFYCMMKERQKINCQICGYRNHSFQQCKYVFYIPNYKELITEHNKSIPSDRTPYYRDDARHKINALINKNLISLNGISFALTNKLRPETEFTNDVMSKLRGNSSYEDSVINDFQDERSSRYSLYQKYQTGGELSKNLNSPQNTLSSQTYQQSLPPLIKLDERESTYNSKKLAAYSKHVDHTQSINSVKVNLVKSTISNDYQMKRNQNKRQTSSSSSINKKLQSTSIMQPKSQTGSIIPSIEEIDDGLDKVQNYKYYFSSYNVEFVARKLNRTKLSIYQISFNNQSLQ